MHKKPFIFKREDEQMKRFIISLFAFLFTFIFFITSTPTVAHADTGPKPQTTIEIYNLEKSDYIVAYGTKKNNGPHHFFIPGDKDYGKTYYGNVDDLTLIYNKVTLPEGWKLTDISSFYENTTRLVIESGYMWPSEFILIIYNKVSNNYYLSEATKTYAFHSYFKYDMNNYQDDPISLEKKIVLEKSYQYGKEILGFLLRLVVTLAVEMLLAVAVKFNKKSLWIIGITNFVTQVGLNLALNLTAYFGGKSPWHVMIYALVELMIVVVEATIFKIFCRRGKDETRELIIIYTIVANALSFVLGMILWLFIY